MIVDDRNRELLLSALSELLHAGEAPSSYLIQSLLSSSAHDPEAIAAARALLADFAGDGVDLGEGAVMELLLQGQGVNGHATSAKRFGLFVSHLADAAKEFTKASTARARMAADLQITPVFAGSVGVRLVVPVPRQTTGKLFEHSDVESDAMRLIAALLSEASEDEMSDDLANHLETLTPPARQALKNAVKEQAAARWDITGTVSQDGHDTVPLRATPAGARRLWQELEREIRTTDIEEAYGTLDGLRYSLQTMWLDDERGERYPVAVPDATLMQDVARLSALPDQRVRALLTVTTSIRGGDTESLRKSRVLQSILGVE